MRISNALLEDGALKLQLPVTAMLVSTSLWLSSCSGLVRSIVSSVYPQHATRLRCDACDSIQQQW